MRADLLDASFVGRRIDEQFLRDLPATVDPCGENGEFHTFVYDGPIFRNAIPITVGEKVFRQYTAPRTNGDDSSAAITPEPGTMGFWFCDILKGS